MKEHVRQIVSAIESDPSVTNRAAALRALRVLELEDFGAVLWSMPSPEHPRLSSLLPRMASEQIQKNWTGDYGLSSVQKTAKFIRSLAANYQQITGQDLSHARALDYGCGYGRMMRLLYAHIGEDRVFGVDPWTVSIDICRNDGIANVSQSDYLPVRLPVSGKFDLMFAFSVFTHTSKRATVQAMGALRNYVAQDGVLAITIRPVAYWRSNRPALAAEMCADHERTGFAFSAHNLPPVDDDVTYGDTSMSIDWLISNCPGWKFAAEDLARQEPLQRYIFLTPV